jgi:hypothetical protein
MVHEPWRGKHFNIDTNEADFPTQIPRLLSNKGTKRGIVQNVTEGGQDP